METPIREAGREPLSTRWKQHDRGGEAAADRGRRAPASSPSTGCRRPPRRGSPLTAGVSEPTIYRTFRSRREMLLAAADKVWQQRRDELESFEATDAMDHLRKICEYHTAGIQRTRVVRFLTELAVASPSRWPARALERSATPRGPALRRHRGRGEGARAVSARTWTPRRSRGASWPCTGWKPWLVCTASRTWS